MLRAEFRHRSLRFKEPAGTSRGTLTEKPSWFLFIYEDTNPAVQGVGECSLIPHLSPEWNMDLEGKLEELVRNVEEHETYVEKGLQDFPALRFALETALIDLQVQGNKELLPSAFTSGARSIPINGLIWMDDPARMEKQVHDKVAEGFDCIKLKIGAKDWKEERALLEKIRADYGPDKVQLRVDANGAFPKKKAFEVLETLAELEVHSIEQPVRSGRHKDMAEVCEKGGVPVALDEELIGRNDPKKKRELIEKIRPQYLVLKPSLVGGFKGSGEWIDLAHEFGIGWWATSALESNIGLNAIAQWTYKHRNLMHQGLGTGGLFVENVGSPLKVEDGQLWYDPEGEWDLRPLFPSPKAEF